MRKNRLLPPFLQCFSTEKSDSKPYDLGGFHFDFEAGGRDILAKPVLPDTKIDASFLGVQCQNLLGDRHRGGQSRRFNSKKVC